MHRLLRTSQAETTGMGYMTWGAFLQLMTEIGFTYDPTTAGSGAVRFDPPNPTDESITFYRTHPDPSLTPLMQREFAKKLKKNYAWIASDFLAANNLN
ncbi:hypothetical protein C8R46DRAFT_1236803 [Mycena filopes]|nr:hypothetical protein C8R46DRAFT_1236803 [Mycena filopes]